LENRKKSKSTLETINGKIGALFVYFSGSQPFLGRGTLKSGKNLAEHLHLEFFLKELKKSPFYYQNMIIFLSKE
jgi:hypothetical protein